LLAVVVVATGALTGAPDPEEDEAADEAGAEEDPLAELLPPEAAGQLLVSWKSVIPVWRAVAIPDDSCEAMD